MDNLPKTPAPKKRQPKNKKEVKSAEDVEVGIQRVAAYERQSLKEELVDATPQAMVTPAHPCQPSESSEQNEGGNITDNVSYQPPSESSPDDLTSGVEFGSLPSPLPSPVSAAGQGENAGKKGKKGQGKRLVVIQRDGSTTESDDELTPFKKVMSEQGKRFGKDVEVDVVEEPTPMKAAANRKGKGKVPVGTEVSATESNSKLALPKKTGNPKAATAMAEDSETEFDEPIVPQGNGNAKTTHDVSKQSSKASAVPGSVSGSDAKSICPAPAVDRPKPRPFKQPMPLAATTAPKKVAAKPAPNPKPSNEKQEMAHPKSSQPKAPKAKSELSMAREALKSAQEEVKKAQEAQKKARDGAKKLKESTKEPGVRDRIKAVHKEEDANTQGSLYPSRLNHLSKNSKLSTHNVADPKPKSNAKQTENPFDSIYHFGSDDDGAAAAKPIQESQGHPMDDIFDFGSFGDAPQLDFEGYSDNEMEADIAEPAAKAVGIRKAKPVKTSVAGGSKSIKSEDASGKAVREGEKGDWTKSMVKDKAKKGLQPSDQAKSKRLIVAPITDKAHQKSTNAGKKRSTGNSGAHATRYVFLTTAMLTLDSTTLFFYSRIVSNNDPAPPSKKRKADRNNISNWVDTIKPNAPPPPSRAASSTGKTTSRTATSSHPPPSLTAGSTRSSNSTLTNTIRVTRNPQLPTTTVKKEPKEPHIDLEDNGIFSDYDETTGRERERAVASSLKHGVRATSSVSVVPYISLSNVELIITHQNMVAEDPSKVVAPPPKSSKPFKKSSLPEELDYDLLCRTVIPTTIAYYARQRDPWDRPASILCSEIRTILRHTGRVDFEVDPKGAIYKNVRTYSYR